jgi:hypothetical protein
MFQYRFGIAPSKLRVMILFAAICWLAALLALAYDASGNAVARRVGPLAYQAQVSALPMWKLAIYAGAPWISYLAMMVAAYFAFEFFGLLGLVAAWVLTFRLALRIWSRGVDLGTIEIDDFLPGRWIVLSIGLALAAAALCCAWLAL